jgi:hypothetical protein
MNTYGLDCQRVFKDFDAFFFLSIIIKRRTKDELVEV